MGLLLLAQQSSDQMMSSSSDGGIGDLTTTDWIVAGAIFVGSFLLAALARAVVHKLVGRTAPEGLARLAGRFAAFLIIVLGFFYSLSSVDVRVGPLLGGLGVLGVAVAFALQEILGNLIAGVMLQVRRPFGIGDQIVTNEISGEALDVNLRVTVLKTFDGEIVFIPNGNVLQNPITNWTKTPTRRSTLYIGVSYDTDLAEAQQTIIDAVTDEEGIEPDPGVQAFVEEFGDNSINFAVRFWHKAEIIDEWRARDAAGQAIKRAFDEAGITMPFPQTTLWFGPDNTELRVRVESGEAA